MVYISTLVLAAGCRPAIRNGDADLPNFQIVNHCLCRGGQPSRAGLERLSQDGVRTIVNVRGSCDGAAYLSELGLSYEHRPMSAWDPNDEDVLWFLRIAADPNRAPVFLHCQHGSDRTGYLIAMYRIVVEGWDRERAIEEMTCDGNGFHPFCGHLIRYVRRADIFALKQQLEAQPATSVSDAQRTGF